MVARIEELAQAVRARQPACGRLTVVAVDGPSGAGKTELADGLAKALGATVLRVDDLVPGWRVLAEMPPALARDVLAPLSLGQLPTARRWDWALGRPGDVVRLDPDRYLVLDGCGSGARVVRPFLSLLLWVDAPCDLRYARAMARDGDVYEPWWDVWAEQERAHFAAEQTMASADVRLQSA
jgi:para-aminobenzoate synthetase